MKNEANNTAVSDLLVVSRTFEAAPELVFDAWLDPDAAGHWLFATPDGDMERVEIDARVGGQFVFADRRDGELMEHVGHYLEIDRPRRLVFTFTVNGIEPVTRVELDFKRVPPGCELTLTHDLGPHWAEWADRTRDGWEKILEGLAAELSGQ